MNIDKVTPHKIQKV